MLIITTKIAERVRNRRRIGLSNIQNGECHHSVAEPDESTMCISNDSSRMIGNEQNVPWISWLAWLDDWDRDAKWLVRSSPCTGKSTMTDNLDMVICLADCA